MCIFAVLKISSCSNNDSVSPRVGLVRIVSGHFMQTKVRNINYVIVLVLHYSLFLSLSLSISKYDGCKYDVLISIYFVLISVLFAHLLLLLLHFIFNLHIGDDVINSDCYLYQINFSALQLGLSGWNICYTIRMYHHQPALLYPICLLSQSINSEATRYSATIVQATPQPFRTYSTAENLLWKRNLWLNFLVKLKRKIESDWI